METVSMLVVLWWEFVQRQMNMISSINYVQFKILPKWTSYRKSCPAETIGSGGACAIAPAHSPSSHSKTQKWGTLSQEKKIRLFGLHQSPDLGLFWAPSLLLPMNPRSTNAFLTSLWPPQRQQQHKSVLRLHIQYHSPQASIYPRA